MERIKTGVKGFDELIQGGIPKGFNVLLVGAPGTGKTIFGLQYLYAGAKLGENGLYVSLDASDGSVKKQGEQFGWNLDKYIDDGKLAILDVPLNKTRINIFDMLEEAAQEVSAKRVVFDSLAAFAINIDQFAIPLEVADELKPIVSSRTSAAASKDKRFRYDVMANLNQDPKGRTFYAGSSDKRITYLVINELLKLGTTNLVITDAKQQGSEQLTVDGVSEFVCDGVVLLDMNDTGGDVIRSMKVSKMRNSKIDPRLKSFNFTEKGIVLD